MRKVTVDRCLSYLTSRVVKTHKGGHIFVSLTRTEEVILMRGVAQTGTGTRLQEFRKCHNHTVVYRSKVLRFTTTTTSCALIHLPFAAFAVLKKLKRVVGFTPKGCLVPDCNTC